MGTVHRQESRGELGKGTESEVQKRVEEIAALKTSKSAKKVDDEFVEMCGI